jgi:hypothetical protein
MTDEQRNEISLLILDGCRRKGATPEHCVELLTALTSLYQDSQRQAAENELLRSQLDYWKEREAADPLPFDDTEVDDEQS